MAKFCRICGAKLSGGGECPSCGIIYKNQSGKVKSKSKIIKIIFVVIFNLLYFILVTAILLGEQ